MRNRLWQAAQAGDTYELYDAILEEKDVLSRIDEAKLVDTPLHIAASGGHADFAKAMMYLMPSFGRKLNPKMYSPMQLALKNGYKDVVLDLLAVDKDLVRIKGREGYTALHNAAENGDIDILARFLKYCPACVEDVTIRNETALHLAVKNNKLEAVEILARFLRRTHLYCKVSKSHLLNSKDRNGNTALHIAASNAHPQIIQVLIECKIGRKETNNEGLTALDMLKRQSSETENNEICLSIIREPPKQGSVIVRLWLLLLSFGKLVIVIHKNALLKHEKEVELALSDMLRSKITKKEEWVMLRMGKISNMSTEKINALLVVVTLILTAIYQAMLSPPGGVWQGEYPGNIHVGESVMDDTSFGIFLSLNFEVFFLTSCVTLIFLHAVTKNRVLTVLFEILLSSLICSLANNVQVILPTNRSIVSKPVIFASKFSPFFSLFSSFIYFEFLRKLYTTFPRRRIFLEFFCQDT
ncbi:hypothetical protein DITRI_Ditri09bG0087800 [Diplodiscus trichospermus]